MTRLPEPEPIKPESPGSGMETHDLVARWQAGDGGAAEVLIDRYYPRIHRIVAIRLGPALRGRTSIEDVLHDVLVRVVEGIERYRERSDAGWIAWVARLAQNEIANQARSGRALKRGGPAAEMVRRISESQSFLEPAANTTAVPSKAARNEEADIVDACVAGLSEAHREVVLLRDYAGGDWAMIAVAMGRSSEACQELHRRACREMRARLEGQLETPTS